MGQFEGSRNGRGGSSPEVHHRQYVIGPEPVLVRPDWRSVDLEPGLFVSHCPSLRNGAATDADGADWILLGLAVQTVADAPDPLEAIGGARTADVPELLPAWAGRWLLIGDGRVHLDASGLLGCIHGQDGSGRTWASSSPSLAKRLISPETPVATSSNLGSNAWVGFGHYPPPITRSDFMRKLLPSQVLELRDGAILPRKLLPEIEPERPYDELIDSVGAALVEAMKRLPRDRPPIAVSLSAGMDSRVALAAAERSGAPYEIFNRISTHMSPADRLLPPQLAAALGRPLTVHRRGLRRRRALSRERLPLAMEHCDGHAAEYEIHPLLEGVRDTLRGISVGGWGFEPTKPRWREKVPAEYADPADGARLMCESRLDRSPLILDGLREWLEWAELYPQAHLDWRDRYSIEQALGGWQSTQDQVYDMLPLERISIINSARTYSLALSIDEESRITARHHHDIVERLCPQLATFPANPPVEDLPLARVVATKLRDDPVGLAREGWKRVRRG